MLRATTTCIFSTYQLPKSAPKRRRFIRFDLETCFAREPPDCTLHRLHFHCFEHVVFMLCRCREPKRGGASRCCLQALLSKWRVRSGAGTLVPLQSAAAGCRRRVLLEGGAVRVVGVLWNGYWCRCRVLLRGAAAGRRRRLLLGFKVDGDAQGAALSGVCVLERAYCKYRCEVPLEGVVVRMKEILWNEHAGACAGCSCQSGVGGDCVYAVVKKASVWLPFKKYVVLFGAYVGVISILTRNVFCATRPCIFSGFNFPSVPNQWWCFFFKFFYFQNCLSTSETKVENSVLRWQPRTSPYQSVLFFPIPFV